MNILSADFTRDPYPFYAQWRARQAVVAVSPGAIRAVARAAEVDNVLSAPQLFSAESSHSMNRPWLEADPFANGPAAVDPMTRLASRRMFAKAGQESADAALAKLAQVRAGALAAELETQSRDFVAGFAKPLASAVLAAQLGAPRLAPQLESWAEALSSGPFAPETQAREFQRRFKDIEADLSELIAARRRTPAADLVSRLIAGAGEDDGAVLALLGLWLLAGFETSVQLLVAVALCWTRHAEAFKAARGDQGSLSPLIEESLRLEPPVHAVARTATQDVRLGDAVIPEGSLVLAFIASANRDERRHIEPDRFDPQRGHRANRAFGFGPQACLGAGLARLVGEAALRALTQRFQRLEIAGALPEWRWTLSLRTLPSLHVAGVR